MLGLITICQHINLLLGKVIIKWKNNIAGRQLYIKSNNTQDGSFYAKYISDTEDLKTYNTNGEQQTYANYLSGDSISYIPEDAKGIEIFDNQTNRDFYEIGLFENGKSTGGTISNVEVYGVTAHKIALKWDQTNNVTGVKVYKDGNYLGISTNKSYTIDTQLIANTNYNFYLEPITSQVEEIDKNEKVKIIAKTSTDIGGLYIDGLSEIERKQYADLVDGNINNASTKKYNGLRIKWTGNNAGKLLYIKTDAAYNSSFYIKYINNEGFINAYSVTGIEQENANYETESVTYIPEDAIGIYVFDTQSNKNFYEIGIFEDGIYNDNIISNFQIGNVTSNSLNLSWEKASSISKTLIYQDGILLGETTGNTYNIPNGLLSNMEYKYTLEPITANGVRNAKVSQIATTLTNNVDFYIEEGNIRMKYFTALFDDNVDTGVNGVQTIFKWRQNISGKQLSVTTEGNATSIAYVCYLDSAGNKIKVEDGSGNLQEYANYNDGETITTVPENAVAISVKDGSTAFMVKEIKIIEE